MPISADSLTIVASWCFWLAVFVGCGSLFPKKANAPRWLTRVWLGISATIVFLQLWHFLFPITLSALGAVTLIGVCGLVASRREILTAARTMRQHRVIILILIAVTLWLSHQSLQGPQNGDSGLYHIPVIRWAEAYAVVPGLANLYMPFGSNQSAFLYDALLDKGPFPGIGLHTCNSLLILLLLGQALVSCGRVLRGRSVRVSDAFSALMLLPSLGLALGLNLTSPSGDIHVFAFSAMAMWTLMTFAEEPSADALTPLTLIATAGVIAKFSSGLFFLGVFFAALILWLRTKPDRREIARTLVSVTLVGVVGVGSWMARSVILSGTLLYPSPKTVVPVSWALQPQMLAEESLTLDPWHGGFSLAALREGKWLVTTLRSFGWEQWDVYGPLALAAVALVAVILLRLVKGRAQFPHLLLIIPTLLGFIWWFVLLPRPRFAGATIWLLAIQCLLWAVDRSPRARIALAGFGALAAVIFLKQQPQPLLVDLRTFEVMPRPVLTQHELGEGGTVTTAQGDQCWDAPLPCTPRLHPNLRMRNPNDLGAGFVIGDR